MSNWPWLVDLFRIWSMTCIRWIRSWSFSHEDDVMRVIRYMIQVAFQRTSNPGETSLNLSVDDWFHMISLLDNALGCVCPKSDTYPFAYGFPRNRLPQDEFAYFQSKTLFWRLDGLESTKKLSWCSLMFKCAIHHVQGKSQFSYRNYQAKGKNISRLLSTC